MMLSHRCCIDGRSQIVYETDVLKYMVSQPSISQCIESRCHPDSAHPFGLKVSLLSYIKPRLVELRHRLAAAMDAMADSVSQTKPSLRPTLPNSSKPLCSRMRDKRSMRRMQLHGFVSCRAIFWISMSQDRPQFAHR